MEYNFYTEVYKYIHLEYKPKYGRIYLKSESSDSIYDLVKKYFWGGNTIPFVAGQIVDFLKSKYNV